MSTQTEALGKQALNHSADLRLSLGRLGGADIERHFERFAFLELTSSVLALREGLAKANQIPIPEAELKRIYNSLRDSDEMREIREGLQAEPIEGPIQSFFVP